MSVISEIRKLKRAKREKDKQLQLESQREQSKIDAERNALYTELKNNLLELNGETVSRQQIEVKERKDVKELDFYINGKLEGTFSVESRCFGCSCEGPCDCGVTWFHSVKLKTNQFDRAYFSCSRINDFKEGKFPSVILDFIEKIRL